MFFPPAFGCRVPFAETILLFLFHHKPEHQESREDGTFSVILVCQAGIFPFSHNIFVAGSSTTVDEGDVDL
jgi:hypothetical protein